MTSLNISRSTKNVTLAKTVRTLREQLAAPPGLPIGTRIEMTKVTHADQQYTPLVKGDEGVVVGGNGSSLWVRFDRGYDITIVPGLDHFKVVSMAKEAS